MIVSRLDENVSPVCDLIATRVAREETVCRRRHRKGCQHGVSRASALSQGGAEMGSDFTVIIDQRQHFGNDPDSLPGTFVGSNKDYEFLCSRVDPNQGAVLLFQTLSVDHDKNFIAINSIGATGQPEVYGGIPVSRSNTDWTGNVVLVRPGILRETNILRLGARDSRGSLGGLSGDVDEFVIDNVVVLYKTRAMGLLGRLFSRSG